MYFGLLRPVAEHAQRSHTWYREDSAHNPSDDRLATFAAQSTNSLDEGMRSLASIFQGREKRKTKAGMGYCCAAKVLLRQVVLQKV